MNIFLFILIGLILGVCNAFALKWTTKKIITKKSVLILFPSLFIRMSVIAFVFYYFLDKNWKNAIFMLLGLTIAKIIFIIKEGIKGKI